MSVTGHLYIHSGIENTFSIRSFPDDELDLERVELIESSSPSQSVTHLCTALGAPFRRFYNIIQEIGRLLGLSSKELNVAESSTDAVQVTFDPDPLLASDALPVSDAPYNPSEISEDDRPEILEDYGIADLFEELSKESSIAGSSIEESGVIRAKTVAEEAFFRNLYAPDIDDYYTEDVEEDLPSPDDLMNQAELMMTGSMDTPDILPLTAVNLHILNLDKGVDKEMSDSDYGSYETGSESSATE